MPTAISYMEPGLVVGCAQRWLGTPYVHQASCKGAGTDCLGLIRGIYRELYGHEPEHTPAYTADWADVSGSETLHDAAARHLIPVDLMDVHPGDVLLFRMVPSGPAKHAGIHVDNDRMIHAYADRAVCETHLGRWWHARLAFAFRWPLEPSPHSISQ
ncbi:NlpC/P60 family protein [Pyruvatibacter sp.]|uniref:NlpC/P60 family protein n=1 Tax=Pyruvatibacter sp. TaxID=1981328 RepID=UPI0032652D3C